MCHVYVHVYIIYIYIYIYIICINNQLKLTNSNQFASVGTDLIADIWKHSLRLSLRLSLSLSYAYGHMEAGLYCVA